jgi:hypothetical protein
VTSAVSVGLILGFAWLARRQTEKPRAPRWGKAGGFLATAGFGGLVVLFDGEILGSWDLLPLAVGCGFWLLPREASESWARGAPRVLESAWAPICAGALTALSIWWLWGSLNAVPVIHDESAYLLQARIFATGRWTAPGRPLPEFFEQTHVFVTPVLAGKYPPFHSLALVPGVVLGLPGLVPVLANGLAGGLVFLLARRLAGPGVALLTWSIWLTAPGTLECRASYLSESTSTALWLLAWWALLQWRDTARPGYLVALAAIAGCEFLTRPLTMLALMIPIGIVVLRIAIARGAWRELALSTAVGALVLCVVPLWSWETIGDWRTTPYRQYSRVYYPYQWAGFSFDETPALRPFPPEMKAFDRQFRRIQREHRVSALPEILENRLTVIGWDMWGGGRGFLLVFAILGMVGASSEAIFGAVSWAVLVLVHLAYAHSPAWTAYYMEGHAVLAFATALGLWGVVAGLTGWIRRGSALSGIFSGSLLGGLVFLGVVLPSLPHLWLTRSGIREKLADHARFRESLARISGTKAIVFVRHAADNNPHRELISNEPDLEAARAWIVHDRGPRNRELLRLAPARVPYLYDESRHLLLPLPSGDSE